MVKISAEPRFQPSLLRAPVRPMREIIPCWSRIPSAPVANPTPNPTPDPAPETTSPTSGVGTPKLINISTRSYVGTGGDVMIAGFIIGGTSPKTVLIRASGPALAAFGVPGALTDP